MSAITISPNQRDQLRRHAQASYPEECCGLLLGHFRDRSKVIMDIWPTENAWQTEMNVELATVTGSLTTSANKCHRFSIDPKEMLAAQKAAREHQLAIIGIYHSHPNGSAIPSEFDRAIAWPQYSYMIIAIQPSGANEILSWNLNGAHQFQPEAIRALEPSSSGPTLPSTLTARLPKH